MSGINSLIGKRFKRDKYGESIWDDEIANIDYTLRLVKEVELPNTMLLTDKFDMIKARKKSGREFGYKVDLRVKAKSTGTWYDINEIIVFI